MAGISIGGKKVASWHDPFQSEGVKKATAILTGSSLALPAAATAGAAAASATALLADPNFLAYDINAMMGGADQQIPNSPGVPTLDDARARLQTAQDLKKRQGRAASILSERPASPLGYSGGGQLATRLLGGG